MTYRRIYWISAGSQQSLLDGYAKVAQTAKLPISPDLQPIDIVGQVLSWLKGVQDWLIVLDNLDDINVLATHGRGKHNIPSSLLPESSTKQHVLITTRNPRADNIPAQGVEVPLFDLNESISLLSTLADIVVHLESTDFEAAEKIVEELGRLPLAISHAAAYTKQVSGSFPKFLNLYTGYRKDLRDWIPDGPQSYPRSVAATLRLSFQAVLKLNPTLIELFRLISFFNPDGILIDFLKFGSGAMGEPLR
jgi:hypothetical protein